MKLRSFLFADRTFRKEGIRICQRTKGTFAFALTHKTQPSANAKEPFKPTHTYNIDSHK